MECVPNIKAQCGQRDLVDFVCENQCVNGAFILTKRFANLGLIVAYNDFMRDDVVWAEEH